jgi:hypothetical protein
MEGKEAKYLRMEAENKGEAGPQIISVTPY